GSLSRYSKSTVRRHRRVSHFEVEFADIRHSMVDLIQRNKVITEGAGALASAALLSGKLKHYVEGKKTVSIISGGNIDLTRIAEIIEQNNIRQFSL
ncbi:hypothetical protein ACET87_02945, partial [Aeromonas veronii]